MHLPIPTTLLLLLPILYPLLPNAHASPLTKRQLVCNATPSPNLHSDDCFHVINSMRVLQRLIDDNTHPTHPPDTTDHDHDLSVLRQLPSSAALDSSNLNPNRLPRSSVAGSCRVTVQFVNGVVGRVPWAEVVARATNLVALCVETLVGARGGTSTFGFLRVVVEEAVVPVVGVQ